MRDEYTDEEWQNARALLQRMIDEVRLSDASEQSPKAVADAFAILAAVQWQMAYDDPDFEKLRAFLVEQRAGARRLDIIRGLNPGDKGA